MSAVVHLVPIVGTALRFPQPTGAGSPALPASPHCLPHSPQPGLPSSAPVCPDLPRLSSFPARPVCASCSSKRLGLGNSQALAARVISNLADNGMMVAKGDDQKR